MNRRTCRRLGVLLCCGLLQSAAAAFAQEVPGCGSLKSGYGPFDYRISKADLRIVEEYHFTPAVEQLVGGATGAIGGDLSYVLRSSPNHHRALMSMVNLGVRERVEKVKGASHSVECFLLRAEAFAPDDPLVKLIFGLYFLKHGQPEQGKAKLEAAGELDSNDANVQYNLGLAYFDLKQYDRALAGAHRAYALGFPLPGLRDKLKRAGKWREPAVTTPAEKTPASAVPDATAPGEPAADPVRH